MKRVELRRHSLRGEGKGLSATGFRMAEQRSRTLAAPYDLVISSPKRRCIETTRAFGFTHYLLDARFSPLDLAPVEPCERAIRKYRKQHDRTPWIAAALIVPESRKVLQHLAEEVFRCLCSVMTFVPDGGKALVVTHGDLLEAVALLGYPKYEWSYLGEPFSHCEGFEFQLEATRITGVRLIRFAPDPVARPRPVPPAKKAAKAREPRATAG